MKNINHYLQEKTTRKEIDGLEKFADHLLKKYKIDIEFTKHFAERMNSDRNSPELHVKELKDLFKKVEQRGDGAIRSQAGKEAILKDINTMVNLPVNIEIDKEGEITITVKTVMRKKNFQTRNKTIKF